MNLEETGFVDLVFVASGPLCPNDYPPRSREHALAIDIGNDVYEAAQPSLNDDTMELPPNVEALTEAAYRGEHANPRMRLYRDTVSAKSRLGSVAVETLFFRCHVCGLVLPAARVPGLAQL